MIPSVSFRCPWSGTYGHARTNKQREWEGQTKRDVSPLWLPERVSIRLNERWKGKLVWFGYDPNEWNLADKWTNCIQAYRQALADLHVNTHTLTYTLWKKGRENPWLLAAVTFNQSFPLQVLGSVRQWGEARAHMDESFNKSLNFSSTTKEEAKRESKVRASSFAWLQLHPHTQEKPLKMVFIGLTQWLMATYQGGVCRQHGVTAAVSASQDTHTCLQTQTNRHLTPWTWQWESDSQGWSTCTLPNGMEGSLLGAVQLDFPLHHSQPGGPQLNNYLQPNTNILVKAQHSLCLLWQACQCPGTVALQHSYS